MTIWGAVCVAIFSTAPIHAMVRGVQWHRRIKQRQDTDVLAGFAALWSSIRQTLQSPGAWSK